MKRRYLIVVLEVEENKDKDLRETDLQGMVESFVDAALVESPGTNPQDSYWVRESNVVDGKQASRAGLTVKKLIHYHKDTRAKR